MPSHPPDRRRSVRPRDTGPRRGPWRAAAVVMRDALVPVVVIGGAGFLVGRVGDSARWGAIALQLEPLFWMFAALASYLAIARSRFARAVGLAAGASLATSFLRMPLSPPVPTVEAPAWVPLVRRCAGAVGTPRRPAKVLQWTIDPSVDSDALVSALVRAAPDVAVLSRVGDPAALEEVRQLLGGEVLLLPEDAPTVALYTRGEFPMCGEQDRWEAHTGAHAGYGLVFAQPDPETTFPLVVARLPSPSVAHDWDAEYVATVAGLASLVERLASPATVVVADASSTSTYQTLAGALRGTGVHVVGALPTWPARVGGVRVPPLHPFDRAWAGESWRGDAVALRADEGAHAPLLVRLSPRYGVGYQRPDKPTPNGLAWTWRSTSTTTPPATTVPPPTASRPAER